MASVRFGFGALLSVGLLLGATACPSDDSGEDTETATTGANTSSSSSTSNGTTTESSTSDSATSDSTTSDSATTVEPTSVTGDITSGGSTGDCPPGTAGCACDEGACEPGLECAAMLDLCVASGVCEMEVDTEPNDVEGEAVDLGEVDCDVVGEVDGSAATGNSDWFTFHGNESDGCTMDSIAIVNGDVDLQVCMFFGCDMNTTQVVCPGDATAETTADGLDGCCGVGDVSFQTQSCLGAGTEQSGTVYLRVDGTDDMACVDYALAYRFY